MNREQIQKMINDHPCHFTVMLKKRYPKLYNEINANFIGNSFSEKTYRYINGNDVGRCEVCSKPSKFLTFGLGFSKRCSYSCMGEHKKKRSHECRKCVMCGREFEVYKIREKTTCSNLCLLELNKDVNVNKRRQETLKNTMLKKYGVTHCSKIDGFGARVKATKLKRYGKENYTNVEASRQTSLARYGVDSYTKTKEYREKSKVTCMRRYGVDNISKTRGFKFSHFLRVISKLNTVVPNFKFEDYSGVSDRKYEFICKKCNNKFLFSMDCGRIPICRKCNPVTRTAAQNELSSFIRNILPGEIISTSSRTVIPPLELDIYIPSKRLAIEYNGLFWHGERYDKDRKYHLNKTELCEKQGIQLIHIFEDEWLNKKDIVKNRLTHILGAVHDKIYARDCLIEELSSETCNDFLRGNHLQGDDKSLVRFGLVHEASLVAVMTFGLYRYATGQRAHGSGKYEMVRFCVANRRVVGAASKLVSHFIATYNPSKIISYADRRWSNKKTFYEKIGFKLVGLTKPNYFYIKKHNNIRYNRLNFQKHKLKDKLEKFDNGLTEWQNMQLNGWDRIWDCGHLKYEWNAK